MAGVASAAIVSGELIIGLDDGQIIRAGYIQGPQGLKGDRGPQGSTGQPGKDGNTLLHGVGTPQFSDGVDGDFFYSTDQVAIYGPRTGGQWGKPVYLRPQDNKSFTLPTGMKSSGGGGRTFSSAMGGGGPSGTAPLPGGAGGSLQVIQNHNKPLPSGIRQVVAVDAVGDAMIVDLWAQSAQGTLFVEIAVSKGSGTDTGYSVVYEISMGVQPPKLTFTPSVITGGGLELGVTSDVALTTLRGRMLLL